MHVRCMLCMTKSLQAFCNHLQPFATILHRKARTGRCAGAAGGAGSVCVPVRRAASGSARPQHSIVEQKFKENILTMCAAPSG